jgi:glycerate dehydrogenase
VSSALDCFYEFMKIVILDSGTLNCADSVWSGFTEMGDLVLYEHTAHDPELIAERIAGATAVFTNKVPLTGAVLRAAVDLKYIGVLATGYNLIDLEATAAMGQTVCNVPGYSTASTAQHAVALILELCNQVGRHSQSVHAGDWVQQKHFSYWLADPCELAAMTVGIVGFGTIGRRVAAALDAMGATILASARTPRDTPDYPGFEWASNEEIFKRADLVSLHCPETPENSNFVNAELLSSMRPGAFLVNTARGGLVDEAALAAALKSGQLAGAAVDVVREEPMRADCPLLGIDSCIITPHIAWASEPARRRLVAASVDQLRAFLNDRPYNVVQK